MTKSTLANQQLIMLVIKQLLFTHRGVDVYLIQNIFTNKIWHINFNPFKARAPVILKNVNSFIEEKIWLVLIRWKISFNPFHANVPFLCPLETSENLWSIYILKKLLPKYMFKHQHLKKFSPVAKQLNSNGAFNFCYVHVT